MRTTRRALYRRGGVALLAAVGILATAKALLLPAVPPALLLRPSVQELPWAGIEDGVRQLRGHGPSSLIALAPRRNYFSGQAARVFYLGRDDSFSARLLVRSIAGGLPRFAARFFLDYRPVEVRLSDGAAGPRAGVLRGELATDGHAVYDIQVPAVPPGRSDLVLVVDGDDPVPDAASLDGDRPRAFRQRTIYVFQLVRGGRGAEPAARLPDRSAATVCPRQEKVLAARGEAVAVINCTGQRTRGVLFGAAAPVFYQTDPGTSAVFRWGGRGPAYHVSNPFTPIEDALGRAHFPHQDLMGS